MKRYIKCDGGMLGKKNREKMAIRNDLRTLARCDSFEDALNSPFQYENIAYRIGVWKDMHPDQADDFEAFYDYMYDSLLELRDYVNQEIERYSNLASEAGKILDIIKTSFQSIITDTNQSPNGYIFISINDPDLEDHNDYIQLADDVKDAINGHYSGTGRGGSWSQWNIRTDSGVQISVGYPSSIDKKYLTPDANAVIIIRDY